MEDHWPILAQRLTRPSDDFPKQAHFFRRCNLVQFSAIYLGGFRVRFCADQFNLTWKSTTCEDCKASVAAKATTDREPRKRAEVAKPRASSEFKFPTLQLSKNVARAPYTLHISIYKWECKHKNVIASPLCPSGFEVDSYGACAAPSAVPGRNGGMTGSYRSFFFIFLPPSF
jgi:hypothetical protein